jgi:aerobic-type carbon monoxide dehydrogenase small subunit (CoxS/CutS family)
MGLFGISEIFINIEGQMERIIFASKIKNLLPNLQDWKRSIGPIGRGSLIGFFLGILPGGGAIVSSFVSYTVEKKISKNPESFGKGAIEGVAAPETANNAAAQSSFIPLLALGIPPNVVLAFLMGALMIHGVTPGPLFISKHPDIFWGVHGAPYLSGKDTERSEGQEMTTPLNLWVNGEPVQLFVRDDETLLNVLRDRLMLTGTKRGCGQGQCGHCTVILNGKSVNSCLTLALEAQAGQVLTIEGLSEGDRLHPIQQAYAEAGAVQCGYCAPGMIMSIYSLLKENRQPDEEEIKEGIKGVMCRCTGYYKVIDAVKLVISEETKSE